MAALIPAPPAPIHSRSHLFSIKLASAFKSIFFLDRFQERFDDNLVERNTQYACATGATGAVFYSHLAGLGDTIQGIPLVVVELGELYESERAPKGFNSIIVLGTRREAGKALPAAHKPGVLGRLKEDFGFSLRVFFPYDKGGEPLQILKEIFSVKYKVSYQREMVKWRYDGVRGDFGDACIPGTSIHIDHTEPAIFDPTPMTKSQGRILGIIDLHECF